MIFKMMFLLLSLMVASSWCATLPNNKAKSANTFDSSGEIRSEADELNKNLLELNTALVRIQESRNHLHILHKRHANSYKAVMETFAKTGRELKQTPFFTMKDVHRRMKRQTSALTGQLMITVSSIVSQIGDPTSDLNSGVQYMINAWDKIKTGGDAIGSVFLLNPFDPATAVTSVKGGLKDITDGVKIAADGLDLLRRGIDPFLTLVAEVSQLIGLGKR